MSTVMGRLLFLAITFSAVNLLSFGPYDIHWLKYEKCKGPKPKNVTQWSVELKRIGRAIHGVFNMTFLSKTIIDQVKIQVYSYNNNQRKILWTFNYKRPCEHFLLSALFQIYTQTASDCVVEKGTYNFSINFDEPSNALFGKSFFYGDYLLKTIIMSKTGNIVCLIGVQSFRKKGT